MKKIQVLPLFLVFVVTSLSFASDGFGINVTGGAGGTSVTVTNAANLTTYATSSSPYIITVSGTIVLSGYLNISSNKTIVGIDANATINGNLRVTSGNSNVIIQYLNITNPSGVGGGDGISISGGAKNIYVTHCTFTDCADGMCDITSQSDSVTVSWCRFRYVSQTSHRYSVLVGSSDSAPDLGYLHLTFHHCWFDQLCNERMPSVRYGRVHVYNSYFSSDSALYCVRTRLYAECLVENNYFEHVNNPWELAVSKAPGTITGKLKAVNNNVSYLDTTNGIEWLDGWYEDDYIISALIPGTDTVFTPPYSYTLDDAQNIKIKVMAGAGNITTPYTITATAGANGSIIPSGVTNVSSGSSLSYSITPETGYQVSDVLVDYISVGAVTSYDFTNITENHTISASFAALAESTPVTVAAGWNLVSVPRVQSDWDADVVFPGKNGSMYSYNTSSGAYDVASTLANGPAYWVNYSSGDIITINGSSPTSPSTSSANSGWVLVGSRETTVDVSSLILSDSAVINGTAYVYNPISGTYEATTVIDPGKGVWINVSKACTVTIP